MDGKLEVLVIDDEEGVLNLLDTYLTNIGCNVTKIKSCEKGIEDEIERFPGKYDLVITDLRQSPKNGLDVAKAVKKISPLTEVYIFTGGASDQLETDVKSFLGEDHFIKKPIDNLKQLCSLVEIVQRNYNIAGNYNISKN